MKLRYISFALCFAALIGGCNESSFLDTKPQGTLNNDNLNTPEGVELLISAAYAALGGIAPQDNSVWNIPMTNWSYGSVRSDDAYKGGGGTTDVEEIHRMETFNLDATIGNVDSKWFQLYCCVQRCNSALKVLNNLSTEQMPEVETRKAEMRLLRAHFYFELSRLYNQVPYFDENVAMDDYGYIPNNRYKA